jgi:hypothetical protein
MLLGKFSPEAKVVTTNLESTVGSPRAPGARTASRTAGATQDARGLHIAILLPPGEA